MKKPFDYYAGRDLDADFNEIAGKRKQMQRVFVEEINEAKLTAAERQSMLKDVPNRVSREIDILQKPLREELARRTVEFWADAREELGYDKMLDEGGCQLIEAKAYDEGHSDGYSEVFCYLSRYVDFAKNLRGHYH